MTRAEKLAEARRLLDYAGSYESRQIAAALRLALDLIEGSESGSLREKQPPLTDAERAASVPFAVPESAALSPAPDFAAMADSNDGVKRLRRLAQDIVIAIAHANSPSDDVEDVSTVDVNAALAVLRANWPKSAPAVVRDYKWWEELSHQVLVKLPGLFTQGDRDAVNKLLRATFGQDLAPAPAFDVEALIAILYGKRSRDSRFNLTMNADAIRDAAREMLKGGVT